jgi:transposase
MESVDHCIAGIDVHKKMLAVVIRKPAGQAVEYIKRKFGTTKNEIFHLVGWLQHHQVSEVVMESTANYWRPVWYGLEQHLKLHLTHPLKTRAPRGRKRDYRDAQRLADRWHSGDLEESFVPAAEQRSWRWMTRSRVQLKRKLSVIRGEVEGILEEGGIKLSTVVTDIFGVSGWAMLEKFAQGEEDIDELMGQARGRLKKKRAQLQEALVGSLQPVYRMLLTQHMEQVRLLWKQVEEINHALSEAMKDQVPALVRLTKIPGVDLYAAQELLAEIGVRALAFPSGNQFASWVGVCPGSQESAGINYSHRSAKGNRYLRRLLCQIAWAATHTKNTFFGALFARFKPRLEAKRANWAVAHRISHVIWLVLHEEVEYQERGATPLNPKTLKKKLQRLLRAFAKQGLDAKSILEQEFAAVA